MNLIFKLSTMYLIKLIGPMNYFLGWFWCVFAHQWNLMSFVLFVTITDHVQNYIVTMQSFIKGESGKLKNGWYKINEYNKK